MQVWFLLLVACFAIAALDVAQTQDQNPAGFVNIDCGAPNNYYDNSLGLYYYTDAGFIDSGESRQISTVFINENIMQQAKNLRVFYNGTRNCYTIRPDKGKGNKYVIRASFYYGNHDGTNQGPTFDLYIGTDYWDTMDWSRFVYYEIIHVPSTDDIQVCLVNTGKGYPFISTLELRSLDSSVYQVDSTATLFYNWRYDIGGSGTYRYPQDVYDRIWSRKSNNDWVTFNTTATTSLSSNNDAYKAPAEVLQTAQRVTDVNSSIFLYWNTSSNYKWGIYFHFAELEALPSGQRREFTLSVNGNLTKTVSLEYLKPVTVASALVSGSKINFSISATKQSGKYPPILNAVEFYTIIEHLNTPTSIDDITAIKGVKKVYNINKESWQGDPCVPMNLTWEGLGCSYDNPPRITTLNLSSSKLNGDLSASFSNLSALVSLDLSGNELTGQLPQWLAEMANLKTLNLSGNNFTGSIPESLQKKVNDQSLQLSVVNNPNLCVEDSCKPNKKKNSVIVPVIAAVAGSVAVLLLVLVIIWRIKSRRGKGATKGALKSKNRPFTYREVLKITDNLKTIIGEGGFGKVYIGKLENDNKVAVKMLSRTSQQGYKEFLAEAQLLMIVHHRNLVSLVGYCDDTENMALIYEFMEYGNLRQHLSDQRTSSHILTWNERLRIAVDAAQGLDYLHNGCKPPIVHRDLKTPNILLNENMQAKIADFGLSKAFAAENDSYISTRPAGTPGYLDPEFQTSGNLNKKSDVYSFGVILLELITGYPPVIRSANGHMHILQWVKTFIERGDVQSIVDPRLQGNFNINSAWKLVEIAMSCLPPTAIQRPDISHVLAELKECWEMETASNRNQRLEDGRRGSMESFDMNSTEASFGSAPSAR
ncbi:hypothetical protein SAY86_018817 [Trapa natans]|uniref:non-specific serine/threonine protein kinase n=1 Tax=Trapa natans TaxID=22666 RepID=A0AAN7LGY6_TRANT|nr:hypothetical protein SAY86_018817 [Trapa natans]